MSVALIIPAWNEAEVIGRTLDAIPTGVFDDIVVVDNGSNDATASIARSHGATVVAEPKRGYGHACLRGIAKLPQSTVVVVFMQADLSEDPAQAHLLIEPIQRNEADLVIGSRTSGGAEVGALLFHQRFGNWLATTLIRILYGYRYSDLGAFRAIRMEALSRMDMQASCYAWTVEMQVRALELGLRVAEVPVRYRVRLAGTPKISGNFKASIHAGAVILSTIGALWWRYRLRGRCCAQPS